LSHSVKDFHNAPFVILDLVDIGGKFSLFGSWKESPSIIISIAKPIHLDYCFISVKLEDKIEMYLFLAAFST